MKPQDFVMEIGRYWPKVTDNDAVGSAIYDEVKNAPGAALKAIYAHMKHTIRPSYSVGVSDVVDAARVTGSVLHPRDSRSFDVQCPGCAANYSYQQGVRDECPYCRFPYTVHVTLQQYEADGRVPSGYRQHYQRLVEAAEKQVQHA